MTEPPTEADAAKIAVVFADGGSSPELLLAHALSSRGGILPVSYTFLLFEIASTALQAHTDFVAP